MQNNTKNNKKTVIVTFIALVTIVILSAGGYYLYQNNLFDTLSNSTTTVADDSENSSPSVTVSEVSLDNDDEGIDWASLPTTEIELSDEILTITKAGTYILSGETSKMVSVNSEGNVRIALNGVNINTDSTPAIYVENAENTIVQLVDGSENVLADGSNRDGEELDGVIYSSDDLIINGEGSLKVNANFADGIVSKDDLKIASGAIVVESVDDGIRGKDSVYIAGGTLVVDATGDGVKSTNETDADKGYVYIEDGGVTVNSGDDAVKAYSSVVIEGGSLVVENSVEGIEANNVIINGGEIDIYASDDGINAVAQSGEDVYIEVNGGVVSVEVGQGDTDAFDANGDIYINGGTIDVTAPMSSFDYDRLAEFNGGILTVNGESMTSIPVSHMHGGPMMR